MIDQNKTTMPYNLPPKSTPGVFNYPYSACQLTLTYNLDYIVILPILLLRYPLFSCAFIQMKANSLSVSHAFEKGSLTYL